MLFEAQKSCIKRIQKFIFESHDCGFADLSLKGWKRTFIRSSSSQYFFRSSSCVMFVNASKRSRDDLYCTLGGGPMRFVYEGTSEGTSHLLTLKSSTGSGRKLN